MYEFKKEQGGCTRYLRVSGNKPVMVLIHGVLTPWQVWMPQIEFYKNRYNVYAVSLNAHTRRREVSLFLFALKQKILSDV